MYRASLLCIALLLCAPAWPVEQFGYRVLEKKAQDRRNFVQGLEIVDGKLYLSSGHYGQSRMMRYDFASGALEISRSLPPRFFGEGLTVLGDRVYQLTWQEQVALVFKREQLTPLEWFPIAGQGWGLTNDGEQLIYSDGSDTLYYLSPQSRQITRTLAVTEGGSPVRKLNELEWIDGQIWANIWQSERIVIIDPGSGEVTGSVDLAGLLPVSERRPATDVLNGIARDPEDGAIWVTGKRWPWLYRIELLPAAGAPSAGESR